MEWYLIIVLIQELLQVVGVQVGGILGGSLQTESIRSISLCENRGEIRGSFGIGGIAGVIVQGTLIDITNYGVIIATGDYVGGISGNSAGGQINRAINKGSVSGRNSVGGIVGISSSNSSWSKCVLTSCKNEGGINSTGGQYYGPIYGGDWGVTIK